MTTRTTSSLGWTAGTNVSSDFSTYLSSTHVAGDTLIVDDFYDLNSTFSLANITIEGASAGDGFDMLGTITDNQPLFDVTGNNVSLINLTFTASAAPVWTSYDDKTSPGAPTDIQNNEFVSVDDYSGFYCRDCDFQDQVEAAIKLNNTNAPFIEYNRFYRTAYPLSIQNNTRNFKIYNNFFEEIISEANKIGLSGSTGPSGDGVTPNWKDNYYMYVNRNAHDWTGGLRDAVLQGESGLSAGGYDIKKSWANDGDESDNALIRNVTITGGHWFRSTPEFVVTTQLQNAEPNWLTTTEWSRYGPRDIDISGVTCELNGTQKAGTIRLCLNKAGINISFDSITCRGFTDPTKIQNERAYWSEIVGNADDAAAPTGWTPDTSPGDGGDSGSATYTNITTDASASGVVPATDWVWTKKPTSRIATLGGSTGLFLGGAPLII